MIKQAIVLAAGKATRLGTLSQTIPKALLPIAGKPILQYLLESLLQYGVEKIVVNTHHHASQMHAFLSHYPQIKTAHEETLLETGGTVLNNLPFFEDHAFFVINGDVLWHASDAKNANPFQVLEAAWDPKKMDALLGVVPREKAIGHEGGGDFFMQADGRLTDISHPKAPYNNTAIKIFHPRLFKGEKLRVFSNRDMYIKAMKQKRLYGKILPITWFHIGTPKALQEAESLFQRYSDHANKKA